MPLNFRTDLASEAHRLWAQNEQSGKQLPGVIVREEFEKNILVYSVEILDKQGEEILGKSIGRYYTMELGNSFSRASESFSDCCEVLASLIKKCLAKKAESFLVAALGNPDITPDAIGPLAASNILVTRHLKKNKVEGFDSFRNCSLCRTGVLGTTGIESAAQIKILCEYLNPDCVIAVDALAGADVSRLCSTIQVCSTGISPGSGVGNNREALTEEFLGVPVVAIGMPTVIDASFFAPDEQLKNMYVTTRDIDSVVRSAGRLIGYGINLAIHNISIDDIDILLG